jgi:hypothetical protein
MVPNPLTSTPSYRAEVVQNIIDKDTLMDEMVLRLPNVPKDTIASVLDTLESTVATNLSNGNSVLLYGFIKLFPSIMGRYDSPDELVDSDSVQVKVSVSTKLEAIVKASLSLSKTPYQKKTPSITYVEEAEKRSNFLGRLLTIKGSNLGFDFTDLSQGVFLAPTETLEEFRVYPYGYVSDTRVVALNESTDDYVTTLDNEYLLNIKVRYTPSGALRTGIADIPLRLGRSITDTAGVIVDTGIFNSYLEV